MQFSEAEFELIKSKLTDLPEEPSERIIAIVQTVKESGISQNRQAEVFCEVLKRL